MFTHSAEQLDSCRLLLIPNHSKYPAWLVHLPRAAAEQYRLQQKTGSCLSDQQCIISQRTYQLSHKKKRKMAPTGFPIEGCDREEGCGRTQDSVCYGSGSGISQARQLLIPDPDGVRTLRASTDPHFTRRPPPQPLCVLQREH